MTTHAQTQAQTQAELYAGRKAVITGGTHGMGRAIADRLLAGGAEVLLTGRNEKNLEAARGELEGARAHVVRSDAASVADIDALAGTVRDRLGGIDLLFVNHGIAELAPFAEVTEESYDRQFAVNTKGAYFTLQRLTPLVRDGGSVVLTLVGGVGTGGQPGMSVYLGTKAALWASAQTLAAELLPRNIRVNAVAPGFIKTPTMGVAGISDEERAGFEEEGNKVTPMGRNGTTDEVADAAVFLATGATFTTAVALAVDGGLMQGLAPFEHP
ncbi:SDR family NAD(P)-dependent oxidoreductase [Streptomyces armeniacus]|uniref:SDR family NAD(P)-dependent oxidoreductase n=1 Tax=Streptomyces armeniacus TaxID=83291 RepID=A0A345XU62_9ACTN|nr:SDR family oxidoreductase [Streptomyces armeniacus]AXK35178.1 SDR family NAD(P)-dependent oxidoreductase [Streptomyces armeniacus]